MATNITEAARSVRLLKINRFSARTAMGSYGSIKSRWSVDGNDWEVRVYPARICSHDKYLPVPWVVVELALIGEPRPPDVRVNLGCRLVDPAGSLPASEEKTRSGTLNACISELGFIYIWPSGHVPTSGYLQDDTLTVQCTITVLKDIPVPTVPVSQVPPMPSSNLHQHLGELLRAGTGADVTFVVSGHEFAAHKAILAARSPVLMAELFGDMSEASSGRVVVQGVEPAAFEAMLHFIYTDTAPKLDQEVDAVATTALAQHLLAAADRYGLDRLKMICEIKLSTGITVDTAATTLALAEQHNCSHLRAKCVDFIVSTPSILDAVVATEGYRHLEASCPAALTSIVVSMRGMRI